MGIKSDSPRGISGKPLGEAQNFNELRMLWSAAKREANGGKPLRDDVREKMVQSLLETLKSDVTYRSKVLAGSILLALHDEDWERDVYRKPVQRNRRVRRTRK